MLGCPVAARASTIRISAKVWCLAEGGRRTLRQTYATEDRDLNLRLLALARGVYDLRSLDAERPGGLPVAVWHGLLTEDRLDLVPFRQPGSPAATGGEVAAASLWVPWPPSSSIPPTPTL